MTCSGHAVRPRRSSSAGRHAADNDGIERPAQTRSMSSAPLQPDRFGDVVERAVGLELIEEPEPLLREGERRVARAIRPTVRRRAERWAGPSRPASSGRAAWRASMLLGEARDRWRFEDVAQGQLDLELGAEPRDKLCRQQRVPAELEEVVERADLLDAQHGGPDRGHPPLGGRARRNVYSSSDARCAPVGRGQRAAVDFAVRRERQALELDEEGRDHVVGHAILDETAQIAGVIGAAAPRRPNDALRSTPRAGAVPSGRRAQ